MSRNILLGIIVLILVTSLVGYYIYSRCLPSKKEKATDPGKKLDLNQVVSEIKDLSYDDFKKKYPDASEYDFIELKNNVINHSNRLTENYIKKKLSIK